MEEVKEENNEEEGGTIFSDEKNIFALKSVNKV